MKKIFLTSSGGILFDKSQDKIFLIYKKERDEWLLPKGEVNPGEDDIGAAKREIQEETGYQNLEPIKNNPINVIEFDYTIDGDSYHKIVYHFCFKLIDEQRLSNIQEKEEKLDGDWFTIQDAIKKISYDNERETIKRLNV